MDDSIRKFRKSVNINGWQCRIYRYTWGENPTFKGYCPLFWAVWLCIILFPFVFLGKIGEFMVSTLIEIIKVNFPKKEIESNGEYKYPQPSDEQIVYLFEYFVENGTIEHYYSLNVYYWAKQNPNWQNLYNQALLNVNKKKEEIKIAAVRREALNKKKEQIINFLSYFVKPVLLISTLVIGYFTYQFAYSFFTTLTWADVIDTIKYSALSVLFITGITVTIGLVVKFVSILSNLTKLTKSKTENLVVEEKTNYFVDKVLGTIMEISSLIIETIEMTYKKECPLVEYSDKSSPIEKIKK